jgi:hypothetical protein
MNNRKHLGTGSLSWNGIERRSDRYGTVMLYAKNSFDVEIAGGAYLHPASIDKCAGKTGRLVCVVKETRQSTHIGDLFRGIFPTTPELNEEIVLGEGELFVMRVEDDPTKAIESIGLKPADGRPNDWLDPTQLYRAHEQTVELYFEALEAGQPTTDN